MTDRCEEDDPCGNPEHDCGETGEELEQRLGLVAHAGDGHAHGHGHHDQPQDVGAVHPLPVERPRVLVVRVGRCGTVRDGRNDLGAELTRLSYEV